MGKHVYLHPGNAEENLDLVISLIKEKATSESRSKAFEDCTKLWSEKVEEIIKDDCPNGAKVSRIRQLFGIKES